MIAVPASSLAPVMLPVVVPIIQLNVLSMFDVKGILNPMSLQVLKVGEFVIKGAGFTVTVMVNSGPVQPADEVGVTMYCTDPSVVLGLVST